MTQPLLNRKDRQGFTIIEVLIVLAIAGLILMIVFLAVPALQRNSRNTQRKNDVQGLLGAISDYEANNNGGLPADGTLSVGTDGSTVAIGDSATSAQATTKLGYYNTGTVTIQSTDPTSTTPSNDTVLLVKGYTCDGNTATATGANRRSIAAVYWIEPGTTKQCVSS